MSDWIRLGAADAPTLIAIQTWTDEVPRYEALAGALGDRSIVCVLPPASTPMPRRVEEWVDRIERILADAPVEPPYHLIGWSFGGVVAVETARRLRAAGVAVTYVGLIDTTRPRLNPLSNREYAWYHLGQAAAMTDDDARRSYVRKRTLNLFYRRFPRLGKLVMSGLVRLGWHRDRETKVSERPTDPLMISIHTSYLNYRGEAVPFPVSLYATAPSLARANEPVLRWSGRLHGGYELSEISGAHYTLFDAGHVDSLADAIRRSLRRLEVG